MSRLAVASLARPKSYELAQRLWLCTIAEDEVLNDVVINQVLVSFGDAKTTREVIRRIQEDGTCWCGVTEWQGRTAKRISVSWATTEADVDGSLEAMVRIART